MSPEKLRVPLDTAWAEELEGFLRGQMKDAPGPDSIEDQAQAVFLAGYCRDLGLLRYAEAARLEEVRQLLRRSTQYTLEVFRMREAGQDEDPPSDLSLTNSRRGLDAMELALASGALDLAKTLAPLIWDPPGASYLGPGSVVCTPEDQHLGYALRDILTGRSEEALGELNAPPSEPDPDLDDEAEPDPDHERRAPALRSLLSGDASEATQALAASHAAFLQRVEGRGPLGKLEDLMDVPTVAYAALGRSRYPKVRLPKQDPYLPLELAGLTQ